MTGAPADFVAALDAWIKGVEDREDRIVRGVAEAALQRVKELTPVDTGFLRANWSVVAGGDELPVMVGPKIKQRDDQAEPVPLRIDLSWVKAGDVIRVVNPVSYARSVEFGWTIHRKDGEERRVEGRHMALRTVMELPQIADRVIADLAGTRS